MIKWDFEVALGIWIASIIASVWFPPMLFVVVATTFNLWHQRKTLYNAGSEFERRVREVLHDDVMKFEERIAAFEKIAEDIKELQIKMMGQFRGRNLP